VKNVAGRRVLITGGAMGMGKIYARIAVEEGAAAVVLWDVNGQKLEETAEERQCRHRPGQRLLLGDLGGPG
jgi:NAD(P)-dependent dehydrogenase (short-subunit alcohol dehydrogenase family)